MPFPLNTFGGCVQLPLFHSTSRLSNAQSPQEVGTAAVASDGHPSRGSQGHARTPTITYTAPEAVQAKDGSSDAPSKPPRPARPPSPQPKKPRLEASGQIKPSSTPPLTTTTTRACIGPLNAAHSTQRSSGRSRHATEVALAAQARCNPGARKVRRDVVT